MAGLSPTPKQQIFGSDGTPLVGGKIYTYAAGTSTPIVTYTDFGAGTANTNPIILDSLGQANIWLLANTSYKFVVKTATETLLYTVDNISTPLDISALASPPPIGNTTPNTGSFTALTVSGLTTLTGTGAMILNAGTTAERPSPSNGMIRYNTTTAKMEGYINSAWTSLVSGTTVTSVATGTGLTGGPITSTGTIAIDSTVATLTGTQTLTNKTIQGGAITSGTAVTLTTQTAIDFTSIPSWVKRITVMLADVSMATLNANALIRIGPSGTVVSTGYSNSYIQTNGSNTFALQTGTTGFIVGFTSNAANNINAVAVLTLVGSNMWSYSSNSVESGSSRAHISLGSISLGGTLNILSVVLASSTFDGGTINILYE